MQLTQPYTDQFERGNVLLTRIRQRQLATAKAGRVRESMYYARLASRVRRVIRNWVDEDN